MSSITPLSVLVGRPPALKLTGHARARMVERGIRLPEVLRAIHTSSRIDRHTDGYTIFGDNGVTVVLDVTMTVVVTVLPRATSPTRWRGPNEGVSGYRRDRSSARNRSARRSSAVLMVIR